jgi:anti-sigma factor (TIGR02949 family)
MQCGEIDRFIQAYVDGEFADEDRAEFERHLAECERCRDVARAQARFKASLRAHLRRPPLPEGLRERIRKQLAAAPLPQSPWRRFVYRSALAAAAVPLLFLLLFFGRPSGTARAVVEESIHRHQRDLPLEVVGPDGQHVSSWFRGKLDFPVQPPPLRQAGADLLGGRVSHVSDRQAAYLIYNAHGQKVSVLIFEPGDIPVEAPRVRRIGNRSIYFDHRRGYNVALWRDGRMGYAFASDLPEHEMVRLVSAAVE